VHSRFHRSRVLGASCPMQKSKSTTYVQGSSYRGDTMQSGSEGTVMGSAPWYIVASKKKNGR
jgi:hypothetical protein